MKFLKSLPLIFLIFLISCSTQVSDSISQTNYKEVEGINFDEKDKIDTSLEDKVFFDFETLTEKHINNICNILIVICKFNEAQEK